MRYAGRDKETDDLTWNERRKWCNRGALLCSASTLRPSMMVIEEGRWFESSKILVPLMILPQRLILRIDSFLFIFVFAPASFALYLSHKSVYSIAIEIVVHPNDQRPTHRSDKVD